MEGWDSLLTAMWLAKLVDIREGALKLPLSRDPEHQCYNVTMSLMRIPIIHNVAHRTQYKLSFCSPSKNEATTSAAAGNEKGPGFSTVVNIKIMPRHSWQHMPGISRHFVIHDLDSGQDQTTRCSEEPHSFCIRPYGIYRHATRYSSCVRYDG